MAIDDRIVDLLLDWEERQVQGEPISPEELCRACPDLLDELKRRIQELREMNGLLNTEKQDVAALAPAAGPAPPLAGGRYRALRFHDKGNLGEVWVAEDTELHREVALKRLQGRRGDADSRRRFLIEAEVTGRLQHPGIVPVYGLVQDERGEPYYAMRFIEGESLQRAVERFHAADRQPRRDPGERNLALRELLGRFVAVCKTMAYAHSRGVLHRDLKPANVMLGKYGETLVVDWGLTKPFERTEAEPAGAPDALAIYLAGEGGGTRTGWAQGTPAYMSPEQAEGRWDEVGPASDIFSLGATLYTLLTGEIPHYDSMERLSGQIKRGELAPPRRVNQRTPAALEAVCLKAMALRREDRYGTAQELAEDVEKWLADERVTAYREPVSAQVARWGRRHKPTVAGLVAVLGSAVVALAVGNLLLGEANARIREEKKEVEKQRGIAEGKRKEADHQRGIAEKNLVKARHFADKADGIVKDSLIRLSVQELPDLPGAEVLREVLLETALKHYQEFTAQGEDVREFPVELAEVHSRIGQIKELLLRRDEAQISLREARDRYQKLVADRPDQTELKIALGRTHCELGNVLRGKRDPDGALDCYKESLRILEAPFEAPVSQEQADEIRAWQALVYNNIGAVKNDKKDAKEALFYWEKALRLREELAEAHRDRRDFQIALARTCSNVGELQRQRGQVDLAEKNVCKSLAIWERLAARDRKSVELQVGVAKSYQSLGAVQFSKRDFPQALTSYRKAQEIWEKLGTVPFYQYSILRSSRLLALTHASTERAEDVEVARRGLEQTCDGWEKFFRYHSGDADSHHECARSNQLLGSIILEGKDWVKAEARFRRAIEHERRALQQAPLNPTSKAMLAAHHVYLAKALAQSAQSAKDPAERRARASEALQALQDAAEQGYSRVADLENDRRLKWLRKHDAEAFDKVIDRVRRQAATKPR